MPIVAAGQRYMAQHFGQSNALPEMAKALGITDECLLFSFDQVRGMTPAEALLEYRLNKLFAALTDQPRQGLSRAIRVCGLGETAEVVTLFEKTFGIDMPLFLLTCRRAADDRVFRRQHPEPEALVLPV
jgi:transcriptional regulator GlxA family with amidase domain